MYSFSIVVIENLYIQTSLMVALSLFRVKEGGALFINQRWTLLGIQPKSTGKEKPNMSENHAGLKMPHQNASRLVTAL